MKTINLFLDMEFTSLSPDAQPISIGIVSEDISSTYKTLSPFRDLYGRYIYQEHSSGSVKFPNSFYAEFNDFDIHRCDDWVKKNVVEKLVMQDDMHLPDLDTLLPNEFTGKEKTEVIKIWLKNWLTRFSEYQIQIVVDCGTWDWYHFLQLVAEWDEVPAKITVPLDCIPDDKTLKDFIEEWDKHQTSFVRTIPTEKINVVSSYRLGLPKLPDNISPVPLDLNDLIAFKKGISAKEAFDFDRHKFTFGSIEEDFIRNMKDSGFLSEGDDAPIFGDDKHDALTDAKLLKVYYDKMRKL